jgi:hypothetical protein
MARVAEPAGVPRRGVQPHRQREAHREPIGLTSASSKSGDSERVRSSLGGSLLWQSTDPLIWSHVTRSTHDQITT